MPIVRIIKAKDNPAEIRTDRERIIFNPTNIRMIATPTCKNLNLEAKFERRKYSERKPIIANMLEE
jgi:hypothetical protein